MYMRPSFCSVLYCNPSSRQTCSTRGLILFDKLAVQVDSVARDFSYGVVLAEDELGGLLVVLVGFGCVRLALLRQLFRLVAVAALVCMLRLRGEVLVLALLFASKIAEAIVFALRILRRAVVEG
jgi:hypothetical protein